MSDPALSLIFWRQIAIAVLCGGLVGFERQLRGRPMGVRTGVLICVSTTVFVALGTDIAGSQGDPTRVLGQVVVGVGFLGGGVIFNQDHVVQGLTSAALIWFLAAVGSCAGLSFVVAPLALTFFGIVLITVIEVLERKAKSLRRGSHGRPKLPML